MLDCTIPVSCNKYLDGGVAGIVSLRRRVPAYITGYCLSIVVDMLHRTNLDQITMRNLFN
jgi:hypothetical protein